MIVDTPLRYFRRFDTEEMLQLLTEQTNLYSVQKNGVSVKTNKKEIEQILGMYLHMGIVQMPSVRMYWETSTFYEPVSGVMSRNRFQTLLRTLHFVDNLTVSDNEKLSDKLWKIRPWLTMFRDACLQVTAEEYNSVDEMMCQYKGTTSSIRQYLKSKPHLWGFKIWGRAGISGILYDFDVYQGGTCERTELGQGADNVLN
uniref:piggyBac transposable element-derived protein 3-like n=1 Tax=Styela clava TaxID=7725 RepID=UPI00193A48C2|nr:piggyBac transposable element-derived protein 3-like [Styela clava]